MDDYKFGNLADSAMHLRLIPYNDEDERSLEEKIADIEYLNKMKEAAYDQQAYMRVRKFAHTNKYSRTVEEAKAVLKEIYDLDFSDPDEDVEYGIEKLRECKTVDEVYRRIRSMIKDKFDEKLSVHIENCEDFPFDDEEWCKFDDEYARKNPRFITREETRRQWKYDADYWADKGFMKKAVKNEREGYEPNILTLKNARAYRAVTKLASELNEESAREEVEMMRQERAEKRVRK